MAEANAIPAKMKAVVVHQFGDAKDSLSVKDDVAVPSLPENEDWVLIQVYSASINPVDYKILKGYAQKFFPQNLPFVAGFDVAGVIAKTSPGCKRLKVGDKVWADAGPRHLGSFAEYMKLPEKAVSLAPKNMSFEEAASIPLCGLTSIQALRTHAKLEKGQKVLILGASGGTGFMAVQIAKALGAAVVVGTASTRNADFVKGFGADQVIDYTKEDWSVVLKDKNFDVVYDTVGEKDGWKRSQDVLKKDGVFVTIAAAKQEDIGQRKNIFMFTQSSDHGDLDDLAQIVDNNQLKASIEKTYSFDTIVDFFHDIEAGRTRGKLVLNVRK